MWLQHPFLVSISVDSGANNLVHSYDIIDGGPDQRLAESSRVSHCRACWSSANGARPSLPARWLSSLWSFADQHLFELWVFNALRTIRGLCRMEIVAGITGLGPTGAEIKGTWEVAPTDGGKLDADRCGCAKRGKRRVGRRNWLIGCSQVSRRIIYQLSVN